MQRDEIMTHNVPLGQQGRMHPWGQMYLVGCLLHFAWASRDWRDYPGNGHLGGRRGPVIRNAWLLLVCDIDSGS